MLAQANLEAARNLLRHTMRLLFGLLVPVLIVITANADHIVELLYSSAYVSATPILRLLIIGIAMYTLLVVLCTIMSADGYPHRAFHISLGTAVIDVPLCLILVPKWGAPGAATATLIASALGVMAAGAYVLKRFGSILPWGSLLRAAIGGMTILALSWLWPSSGWVLLLELALLFGVYFFVLYVLGELKNFDGILLRK
jgi:O-antigen/teichoic acid export membrane protein